tara:strand:- start:326 stop:679 length:354 start_codon:yes stop_codon:yes gene_type:complete
MDTSKLTTPKSWKIESIIATVIAFLTCCCCYGWTFLALPLGIIGIVNATKAEKLFSSGDIVEGEKAAKNAKLFTLISFGVVALAIVAYFLYVFFVVGMSAADLANPDYYMDSYDFDY